MKKLLTVFLCSFFLFGTVAVCGAVGFTLENYTVTAFEETESNQGLDIIIYDLLPDSYDIGDLAVNVPVTVDLFGISTTETAVNRDDYADKPISVRMDFSSPEPDFFNTATGFTDGFIAWGRVWWNNPTIFSFGSAGDGILTVTLSEPNFALNILDCIDSYSTVRATFELVREATPAPAPVPEPSTILLMGVGLLGLVAVGRRKFNPKE